jgi:hypothetical protein
MISESIDSSVENKVLPLIKEFLTRQVLGQKVLLTENDLRLFLDVSSSTIRRLRKSGLPASKVGGKWYYKKADVSKWVEGKKW